MGLYTQGESQEVEFSDFAPDKSPTTPGIITSMSNFIPTVKGYEVRAEPETAAATVLPGFNAATGVVPNGAYIALFSDGTTKLFAAHKNNIYRLDGTAWTSVGGPYTATTRWRFTQFGNDVIAVAGGVVPQVTTGSASTFANLTGSPPTGLTNVTSIASTVFGTVAADWYNSAIGSDNQWAPDIQTQAATGTITDFPGSITALAPLFRNVVIFKQSSIEIGSILGGVSTWDFEILSDTNGTPVQEAVVFLPEAVGFLGTDDFYLITGYTPLRIPNNVKEYFFTQADPAQLSSTCAWYDPIHSIIYWHYVSKTTPYAAVLDKYVAYNVRANKWAEGNLISYFIVPNTQPGRTDGYYFDITGQLMSWTGDPGSAWLRTGFVGDPGRMVQGMRVRPKHSAYPFSNPVSTVVTPFHTPSLNLPAVQELAAQEGNDGWHYMRQYDRYHQIQVDISGTSELVGLSAEFRLGGSR